MAKKKNETPGKVSLDNIKDLLNKSAGMKVARHLGSGDNPSNVKDWIPTGSTWLDSIVCRGKSAGIPVGKITEIAGLEGSGKSYMAAMQICLAHRIVSLNIPRAADAVPTGVVEISLLVT